MQGPGRRMVTTVGLSAATTLTVGLTIALDQPQRPATGTSAQRYVAAASATPIGTSPVAPLSKQITPHVLAASPQALPEKSLAKIRKLDGVKSVEVIDAVRALVGNKRVGLLGVDPSTFRAYTPKPTAESDALWRNIAAGDMAVSVSLGQDGGAALASSVPVGAKNRQIPLRVGAYATMGMGEVDAVVSRETAGRLGMPKGNALLISAPAADPGKLTKKLRKALPKKAKTAVLAASDNLTTPSQGDGTVMTAEQIQTFIAAARTKLGMPYVWGGESDAEGGYDCSGLVQFALAKAGVKSPRTADIQAFIGPRLPYNQARVGDLLTWKNDPTFNGVSHIAIYLGGGKMLVAPRRGTLVQIQNVYMNNFWGAIRINPRLAAQKAGGR